MSSTYPVLETEPQTCTYNVTQKDYYVQKWATCFDCLTYPEGACIYCLKNCHAGHNIGPIQTTPFYCDCGANNMCTKSVESTPNYPGFSAAPKPDSKALCKDIQLVKKIPINTLADKLKLELCSPLSITYILAMLQLGAVDKTYEQLTSLLRHRYTLEELSAIKNLFTSNIVRLTNAIIINNMREVSEAYVNMVKDIALVSHEDFNNTSDVVQKANNYIEMNTNGLIKDILKAQHININTIMILINTLYFKTAWNIPFKKRLTTTELFNNKLSVQMMLQTANHFYFENSQTQILRMMYSGCNYCMDFVLPKVGFEHKINEFDSLMMNLSDTEVEVHIPKFTQRQNYNLIPVLQKMGLTDLFSMQSRLDNISKDTYVSTMIHEAVVLVDEEGTEAAAVSIGGVRCLCIEPVKRIPVFYANRTFKYYIKHLQTGTILFTGTYDGN